VKLLKPRPAVRKMAPYTPPTGGRAGKMRLDFNENTVGCSPRVIEALRRGVSAEGLAVYPEYGEAKADIARYFGVAPEQFIFTNGTDEAIQVFINTYVYRFYAEVAGAGIREIAYPPRMEFPLDDVLGAITKDTRAILLANPNNPTGTAVSVEGMQRILRKARHAAVLIDEAYYEFSGITMLPEIAAQPNLFVCRTFSKVFGMAAMRLGCLFSQEANVHFLRKAQSPYSVNALAILAARAAVRDVDYVRAYVAEALAARELLCLGLDRLGIGYAPSSANFVLGRFGTRAIEVRDALRARGILVRDRSYEAAGAVRITVGTRQQTRRMLAALQEILEGQPAKVARPPRGKRT
jgi:histidinol-phosphate aminotransferase